MVLRFKVWRLQEEKRANKTKTGLNVKYALVLRDLKGHIRKVATTKEQEVNLRHWYDKYNRKQQLEDVIKSKKIKEIVRKEKRAIRKRGFKFQISVYGVYKEPSTGEKHYRRYEIFKAEKWKRDEVAAIHNIFKKHPYKARAGVFMFHYIDGKPQLLSDPTSALIKQ